MLLSTGFHMQAHRLAPVFHFTFRVLESIRFGLYEQRFLKQQQQQHHHHRNDYNHPLEEPNTIIIIMSNNIRNGNVIPNF